MPLDRREPDLTLHERGVAFVLEGGVAVPRPLGAGEDPLDATGRAVRDVPALGGTLLVRRSAIDAAGGRGHLGAPWLDGVDLSIRLRAAGAGRIVCDGRAAVWRRATAGAPVAGSDDPWLDRWGVRLTREVLLDALSRERRWTEQDLHVGITVTRDDPSAGYGDWHTGHELGDALAALGVRVSYLERFQDRWYRPDPSIDVVLVLLDRYDIRRLPRGIVTVAWMRNWGDTWVGHPWFDDFDLVFGSSDALRGIVAERTAKVALPMPIATNPARFRPVEPDPRYVCDVLFVGNHWGEARGVAEALPALAAEGLTVHVHGRNWENVPGIAPLHRGYLDYDDVPTAYASARVVVDDTASPTRPYGAVNSRVFDALASGALVVTDNEAGARELFDGDLPIWTDTASLVATVREALASPDGLRARVARARARVLDAHTYDRRASTVCDALAAWAAAARVGVRIGPPNWEAAQAWGDLYFARAIQRRLERRGHPTRVDLLPEWGDRAAARHDATIHLFGLRVPRNRPSQVNVLWHISHPDLATAELYDGYDVAFAASERFARRMASMTARPVEALPQATDPDRFHPAAGGPAHEILFVGNTRGVRRKILDDLGPTGHDLAVYGKGWSPELVDPSRVRGEGIPNADLHRYYAAASIVLNDHWPDMRAEGFLSNRLYDVLASGGFVISDRVDGIDTEFDGAVPTYERPEELRELVERLLADPEERARLAATGRRAVLERHTFEHRVATILDRVTPLLRQRPARLS